MTEAQHAFIQEMMGGGGTTHLWVEENDDRIARLEQPRQRHCLAILIRQRELWGPVAHSYHDGERCGDAMAVGRGEACRFEGRRAARSGCSQPVTVKLCSSLHTGGEGIGVSMHNVGFPLLWEPAVYVLAPERTARACVNSSDHDRAFWLIHALPYLLILAQKLAEACRRGAENRKYSVRFKRALNNLKWNTE